MFKQYTDSKRRLCLCVACVSHLFHAHLLEGSLQQLEIVDVFVFKLGTKLDLLQHDRVVKQHVHELTIGGTFGNRHTSAQSDNWPSPPSIRFS